MRELINTEIEVILSMEHAGAAFKKVNGVMIDETEEFIIIQEKKRKVYIQKKYILRINV